MLVLLYLYRLDDLACDMPNSPSLESDTNTVPADVSDHAVPTYCTSLIISGAQLSSPKNQAILAAIKRR